MASETPVEPKKLRSYPAKWKGSPLLVCSKCQRKLKHSNHSLKLKKALKSLAKTDPTPHRLHIISVPCMKLCPKGGITVCTQQQLATTPPTVTIVYTEEDAAELYRRSKQ
jgi:predicted metal-binding protein